MFNLHRWYEPQTGRYTRTDPLPELAPDWPVYQLLAFHTYAYVQNRPLLWSDPKVERVTGADILNCLNPATCGTAVGCRLAALKRTLSLFGNNDDGTEGNAFQHCFWTCCMAKQLGSERAKDIGRGHEASRDNQLCHALMDLANNASGAGSSPTGPAGGCQDHCQRIPLQKRNSSPSGASGQGVSVERSPRTGAFRLDRAFRSSSQTSR